MGAEMVLWAVKIGTDHEELITSTNDRVHFEKAKQWAIVNGFHQLRESTFNWEKPDFVGAIRRAS